MKPIDESILIAAPASAVWAALVDTDHYLEWNPFITKVSGTLGPAQRLSLRISPPGGKAMTFAPTVTAFETEQRLEWLGHLGIPGLFDSRHSFALERAGDMTQLTQAEAFSGALTPFAGKLLERTAAGFAAMNTALRDRVVAQDQDPLRSAAPDR